MSKRTLDKIGLPIPLLGFGAMRLPMLDKSRIDTEQVAKMVDYSLANGFNYFDTAYPYHDKQSEIVMREALVKRHPRESFYLADKMPVWLVKETKDYDTYFNEQLEKCGVDYFDFYMLHALNRNSAKKCSEQGGFEFLKRMKAEGKIRFGGFSFHDEPEILQQILDENPGLDFVQLQINYLDWEGMRSEECYRIARAHDIPIIIMEPVKGGSLASFPPHIEAIFKEACPTSSVASWAIRYCASLEGVMTVLSGMSNLEQLYDNVGTMSQFKPITHEEEQVLRKVLEEYRKIPVIPCTSCKYCVDDCPSQINIPQVFNIYNLYKRTNSKEMASGRYSGIDPQKRADSCISCGSCVTHCPQHIDIPRELEKVAEAF